jgi:hypothetical protein
MNGMTQIRNPSRIFSVGNSKNIGIYVAAISPELAAEFAIAIGHAKAPKNLRITDITDDMLVNTQDSATKKALKTFSQPAPPDN